MFKSAFVLLFLALVHVTSASSDDMEITPLYGEGALQKIVKGIADRLCHGIPSMGIPQLEPVDKKGPYVLDINNDLAELSGEISNVYIEGIRRLDLTNIAIQLPNISFEIKIPQVKLSTKFKLKGTLGGLISIDGDGSFKATVDGIEVRDGRVQLVPNEEGYKITQLQAKPSIKKLVTKIDNLAPNEKVNAFIQRILNTNGTQLFDDLWYDYGENVLNQIEKLSKDFMAKIDSRRFKLILAGFPAFKTGIDPKPDCP